MMQAALGRAESLGHGAVLLVGDAPYYARFGFDRALAEGLTLPGPFERARFLGLELRAGALAAPRVSFGRPACCRPSMRWRTRRRSRDDALPERGYP